MKSINILTHINIFKNPQKPVNEVCCVFFLIHYEIQFVFYIYSTSQFRLTRFQTATCDWWQLYWTAQLYSHLANQRAKKNSGKQYIKSSLIFLFLFFTATYLYKHTKKDSSLRSILNKAREIIHFTT